MERTMAEEKPLNYSEIVKELKSEPVLNQGRNLLVKSWHHDYDKEEYIKELLEYVRDSMKQIVHLEAPDLFDEEERNALTEPEGKTLF